MGRSTSIAVVGCLLAAALAWLFAVSNGLSESHWIAAPETSLLPDEAGSGSGVRLDEVRTPRAEVEATRGEDRPEPSEGAVLPTSFHARVRVRGQVRRAGRAVADYVLAFRDSDDDEVEWEFTDDEGRFEVELSPASYVVMNDDEGTCAANVVVSAGETELVLNIDLPPK